MSAPLSILYVAAGIPAPGTVGGSTHVVEVTRGLARRGHRIVTIAGRAGGALPADWPWNARLVSVALPKALGLGLWPIVAWHGTRLGADVVMERYYNLAGAGLLWAKQNRLPSLLEVNAPLWDPPRSPKDRLDRRLPGHPLRRWATWQALAARAVVAPLPEAVTVLTPHPAISRLPWGANTDEFDPAHFTPADRAAVRANLGLPAAATVVVFAGSFRRWHGIETLFNAVKPLLAERADLHLLLVGAGERWEWARTLAATPPFAGRVVLTGSVPYQEMPRHLASADFAVAPFDVAAHAPLQAIGFYWSPLKIFEAMAMALPIVLPAIPELTAMVRDGLEGTTYAPPEVAALTRAIAWQLDHSAQRSEMGQRARDRVVEHYSWTAHCAALEQLLLAIRDGTPSGVPTR